MTPLRFTLLGDGASDRALITIITWCIGDNLPEVPIQGAFADFRRLFDPPRGLANRMHRAIDLYPCDLLFVHRDAENEPAQNRVDEVERAVKNSADFPVPVIPVVTVRMQEAWFLFDETAIRKASGNPNGKVAIDLPPIAKLEAIPDPKEVLHTALRIASGLKGRRLRSFRVRESVDRVAGYVDDFSPLRRLSAFREFESRMKQALDDRDEDS